MHPVTHQSAEPSAQRAFTLVELMVSMTVFGLILAMVLGVISQTRMATKFATQKISAFQGARAAFDIMARNLSQATLNAYWDYDKLPSPTRYLRKSELHFLIGKAGAAPFLGTDRCGQAVFFQAPTGFTGNTAAYGGLENLLNAMGYYVEYRAQETLPAPFPAPAAPVYRYHLMQAVQPTEGLQVYASATGVDWMNSLANNASPIAENVICLIVWPRRSPEDDPTGLQLSSDYTYDSRLNALATPQPTTANQLPPALQLTIVAIDETSAARLCVTATPPSDISNALNGLFTDPAKYAENIATLEGLLSAKNINFRTFTVTVPIRESKME